MRREVFFLVGRLGWAGTWKLEYWSLSSIFDTTKQASKD